MIHFKRDEHKLIASINDGITDTNWLFEFNLGSKSRAEICRRHFDKKLMERVQEIRKKAYEDGYKHGRNHEKKFKTFSPYIGNDDTGWKF